MSRVLVIGGGPAGMMAAVRAAQRGNEVTLLEKNEKLGKKLYITGKGRCNVTNDSNQETLLGAVMTNRRFLYSAFYTLGSREVMDFFEAEGVPLKTERGNRVFPVSDHSSDIIRALERRLKKEQAAIRLRTEVHSVLTENAAVRGVRLLSGEELYGDAVIVATGGLSYPSTGSTGDGYRFAAEAGHSVTEQEPSLVPFLTEEDYIPKLQGLSLRNAGLSIFEGKKKIYEDFGEMMFTHEGVTGPMILSASAAVGRKLSKGPLAARIDLKPALSEEKLDQRLLREFTAGVNRQFKNVISNLYPSSLTPVMIDLSGIEPDRRTGEITREERQRLLRLTKALPFTITGTSGFREAIITRGGVNVKEIDPGTMESRLVRGLFFAGEVLDLDAVTGGFNLQIAWSTGYLAGDSVPENNTGGK